MICFNICSYQNGPDTYLLQLRDTDFPVRLREYMKVACHRSPAYNLSVRDAYDPRVSYNIFETELNTTYPTPIT